MQLREKGGRSDNFGSPTAPVPAIFVFSFFLRAVSLSFWAYFSLVWRRLGSEVGNSQISSVLTSCFSTFPFHILYGARAPERDLATLGGEVARFLQRLEVVSIGRAPCDELGKAEARIGRTNYSSNYSSKFVRIRQTSPEFANMENSRKSEKF